MVLGVHGGTLGAPWVACRSLRGYLNISLRNALAQVLIWHLPEYELSPSGRLWDFRGGPWGTVGRLGEPWGSPGGPWRSAGVAVGSLGGFRGSLGGPGGP